MNEASQWRLHIAERIGPLYTANPKVAAVMVGGSTARGYAERRVFHYRRPTWDEAPQ